MIGSVSYFVECYLSHQSHTEVCIILKLNFIPNSAFGKKICMLNLAIFFPWHALHQTVFTLSHHRRRRVLSSLRPAVCPSIRLSIRHEGHYCSNSLRISAISLKFSAMMHSTMEQIAIKYGHAPPIFPCSTKLLNFP